MKTRMGSWMPERFRFPMKLLLENTEDIAFSNQEGEYRLSFIREGIFPALEKNPYLVAVPASRQTAG